VFTTLSGTIAEIKIELSNSTSGSALGFTAVSVINLFRLTLANTPFCIDGN
jgi:hypothetical protein